MLWRRSDRRAQETPVDNGQSGVRAADFAWRVHAAQEAWTAKVDTKAAIFLTLETAVLAALTAARADDRLLAQLAGWRQVLADAGIALSAAAVFVAGLTVIPLLGRTREHRRGYRDHLIYFGHLRHWDFDALAMRLGRLTAEDELRQLSRQLVELSRRNWVKHRRLQVAMALAVLGVAATITALLWPL